MELEARFERLEREVRFWRLFSILLAIGGALAFLVAAGPKRSRVVTAERFELVGADGKKAGDWWVAEDGPALRMDGAGGSGVRLGADNGRQQQSFVRMWGPKNSSLIILESYAESAQVKLLNPGGGGHYLALVQDDSSGELRIHRNTKVQARVRTDVTRSYLEVKSPSGVPNLFTSP